MEHTPQVTRKFNDEKEGEEEWQTVTNRKGKGAAKSNAFEGAGHSNHYIGTSCNSGSEKNQFNVINVETLNLCSTNSPKKGKEEPKITNNCDGLNKKNSVYKELYSEIPCQQREKRRSQKSKKEKKFAEYQEQQNEDETK